MSRVERVEFSVPVVFGWQRAGHSGHFYKTRETGKVQEIVAEAFKKALPEGAELPLFGGNVPVIMTVDTYRPLPVSRPKRVLSEPDTFKPDFDNIAGLRGRQAVGRLPHDQSPEGAGQGGEDGRNGLPGLGRLQPG